MTDETIIAQGRYVILERLAAGGFKTVWRAEDRTLERQVALAVLHDDTGVLRSHFWKEATALAALTVELPEDVAPFAPRVVAMTDFGELDDEAPFKGPYIATHLVPGRTVKEVLSQAPLPWRRAVRI